MVDLLYCEILKLKRSKMFLFSIMGAAAAPVMCFIGCIKSKLQYYPDGIITFGKMFSETNLYTLVLVGVTLYGVITAYLFSREYTENTLKSILTIPVAKTKFFVGKHIVLFLWIMALTLISWLLTFILGVIVQLEGLDLRILFDSLGHYLSGGFLVYLLTTPFVLITLWFKNLVPTIIFSVIITMGNAAVLNDVDFVSLYPWSATYVIASGEVVTKYPLVDSYLVVFALSIIGFAASLAYFRKMDIR